MRLADSRVHPPKVTHVAASFASVCDRPHRPGCMRVIMFRYMTHDNSDIKRLSTQYRTRVKQHGMDQADFVEKPKMVESHDPLPWAGLRKRLRDKVNAFNREMGSDAISWDDSHSEQVSITRKLDGVKLKGGYDPSTSTASFECSQAKIDYKFALHGEVEFLSFNPRTRMGYVNNNSEDIAHVLMRDFLIR
jgi:hypothetical protein